MLFSALYHIVTCLGLCFIFVGLIQLSYLIPRYRIVKYSYCGTVWYTPQKTGLMWCNWEDMTYKGIEHSDNLQYKFQTFAEAQEFLDILTNKSNKPTMTVVKG